MSVIPFIPLAYQMRLRDMGPQQIIFVNWLKFEAMPLKVIHQYPVLHEIKGWRNRECYDAIQAYDWTARIYEI